MIEPMIVRLFTRFLATLALASIAVAPVATMAQAPEKVEILLDWKPLPTYAGFYIAREQGAFERRGLDVTFKEVQGATAAATEIGSGKQFWIGTSSGMATAIGRSGRTPARSAVSAITGRSG